MYDGSLVTRRFNHLSRKFDIFSMTAFMLDTMGLELGDELVYLASDIAFEFEIYTLLGHQGVLNRLLCSLLFCTTIVEPSSAWLITMNLLFFRLVMAFLSALVRLSASLRVNDSIQHGKCLQSGLYQSLSYVW